MANHFSIRTLSIYEIPEWLQGLQNLTQARIHKMVSSKLVDISFFWMKYLFKTTFLRATQSKPSHPSFSSERLMASGTRSNHGHFKFSSKLWLQWALNLIKQKKKIFILRPSTKTASLSLKDTCASCYHYSHFGNTRTVPEEATPVPLF